MYIRKSRKFQRLEIGLASPSQIQNWAKRYLPNGDIVGEVTSWETVNYKTLKPEPNGLFCQRIFGPVIDYTCACGKKATKIQIGFCPKCGVERTNSRVRRYRLGYITLKQPIVHTLYATHKPSPLSLCLDWSNKRVQAVMYGTEFCHLSSQFKIFSYRFEIFENLLKKGEIQKNEEHGAFSQEPFFTSFFNVIKKPLKTKTTTLLGFSNTKKSIVLSNFSKKTKLFRHFNKILHKSNLFPNQQIRQLIACKKLKNKTSLLKSKHASRKFELGLHLYGVAYDMTWRQVEDLQEFLLYCWEQPVSIESFIPSYTFTTKMENRFSQEIPKHQQYYPIQTGGFVYQRIFSYYDLLQIQRQLALEYQEIQNVILYFQAKAIMVAKWEKEKVAILKKINRLKHSEKKCLRRLHYFRDFEKNTMHPAWMVLSYLPVLPPGLRPITSIRGELIVSDINSLYRRVLTRNKRLTNTSCFDIFDTALSGSWASWCYNLRQVQEAVDALLKNGSVESGKISKSLLDALKGKKGRFRQHLLGKRVDYSGRSVIVVGPNLKIHECGIPKHMAIELFQPFLIQRLRNQGIVFTTTAAKAIISERKPIIWNILREILKNHPVLLNRAPTLHRLGIQAFLPKLVEGKAILLHPLVCPAFNADFDGDQMAVHVPLSPRARAEALNLLWSRNQLLAPASGQPLLLPTQDMVLGFYYLTISKEMIFNSLSKIPSKSLCSDEFYFSTLAQAKQAYQQKRITKHTPMWVCWNGRVQNLLPENHAKKKEFPLEIRISIFANCQLVFTDRCQNLHQTRAATKISSVDRHRQKQPFLKNHFYIRTTIGRILMYEYLSTMELKK